MKLVDRISRPRIEFGVDHGAKRIVVARAGDREVQWEKSHSAWRDRMSGYVHEGASLVFVDYSTEDFRMGTDIQKGGRLSRKMLERYECQLRVCLGLHDIDGRPGSCQPVPSLHEVYKAGFTIVYEDGDFMVSAGEQPSPGSIAAEEDAKVLAELDGRSSSQLMAQLESVARADEKWKESVARADTGGVPKSLIIDGREKEAEAALGLALAQFLTAEGKIVPVDGKEEWMRGVVDEARLRMNEDPIFYARVRMMVTSCMTELLTSRP